MRTPPPFVPTGTRRLSLFLLGVVVAYSCFVLPATQAGEPASAAHVEQSLRHVRLDLGAVRRWQEDSVVDEQVKWSKPLLVVHLFSLDCPPCMQELPLLKAVFRAHPPDIDFVLLLETLDVPRIREFLLQNSKILPVGPLYLNTDGRLRGRSQIGNGTVPITLLLDQRLVIRQAFVGTLKGRMHELTEALHDLLPALKYQPQPLSAALIGGMDDSKMLLHRWVDLSGSEQSMGRRDAGHRDWWRSPRLHLLYLFGSGCNEYNEELAGRLLRMSQDRSMTKRVRFSILDCGAEVSASAASSPSFGPAGRLLRPCRDKQLQAVWTRVRQPVTLLVDSQHVVRDAFIGPMSDRIEQAVRRLLADRE